MISVLIFVVTLIVTFWFTKTRSRKEPPGPLSLPIVGYYPFLGSQPLVKLQELSEKYGSVMKLNLLGEDFYFLNSFEAVNEALNVDGETFSGRPSFEFSLVNEIHGLCTLQTAEGHDWKIQQRFYMGKLSGLGMGKTDFALRIHQLCDDLIGHIKKEQQLTNVMTLMSNFTSNVISLMLFSEKYEPTNQRYTDFCKAIYDLNIMGSGFNFYLSGPVSGLLFKSNRTLWNKFVVAKNRIYEVMFDRMKDRIEHSDGKECIDVLDYCIQEMNGSNSQLFDKSNLIGNFILLLGAGTDTTSSTLTIGLFLMAKNLNVQRKVYEEIVETFGNEYKVLPTDIEKLNVTRAVIDEIQRFACVVPFGLVHCNIKPATICGYNLPKRRKVIANILMLSRDKKYFKNPDSFDPNNFLDENGKYTPNMANIPFGIGKRQCLGKKLAEMELIVAFTRLIQQFEWLPPKDEEMHLEINETLVRHPSPFNIIAKQRV